jgi:hypothetical protein
MPAPTLSLQEFASLPVDLQSNYLWDNGIFLINHRDQRYCINLYSLHDYYVEVWYDTLLNQIHAITAFTTSRRLESYVNSVSITNLL